MKKFDRYNILIAGELLLGAALALFTAGATSFWLDEITGITMARTWSGIGDVLSRDGGNMWLYYVILHFWLVLGESEFAVRSLSALFAVLSIGMMNYLGTKYFDKKTGLWAGLILLCNVFFLQYAQEARSYSLTILLSLASTAAFFKLLEKPTIKSTLLFVISALALIYSHLFGILLLGVQGASLFFWPRWKENRKYILGGFAAVGAGILPLILFRPSGGNNLEWIPKTTWESIKYFYGSLAGGSGYMLGVYAVLLYFLLRGIFKKENSESSFRRFSFIYLLLWVFLPAFLVFGTSLFLKPIFMPRYLIFVLPGFILMGAAGFYLLKDRLSAFLLTGILVAHSLIQLNYFYERGSGEDWRGAAAAVLRHSKPQDGILFFSYAMKTPFFFYAEKGAGKQNNLTLIEYASSDYPLGDGGKMPEPDFKKLTGLPATYERLWVVFSHHWFETMDRPRQARHIMKALEENYKMTDQFQFPGIFIMELQAFSK